MQHATNDAPQRASGSFRVSGMKDEPYDELDGDRKLTRATGDQAYAGDITGRGGVQWLMAYRGDGTARFLGLWHVTGSILGRDGSFVMECVGDFDGKASHGTLSILEALGTGDLKGMRGGGTFRAPGGPDASYELDFEFA